MSVFAASQDCHELYCTVRDVGQEPVPSGVRICRLVGMVAQ